MNSRTDYPPEYDEDPPCELCGHDADTCCCPTCPVCKIVGSAKCYTEHKLIRLSGSKKIRNIFELAYEVGAEAKDAHTAIEAINRRIYKDTACGAWVAYAKGGSWHTLHSEENGEDHSSIQIGSIVEGTDACTSVQTLKFPFRAAALWDAIKTVESEAQEIWDSTHNQNEEEE